MLLLDEKIKWASFDARTSRTAVVLDEKSFMYILLAYGGGIAVISTQTIAKDDYEILRSWVKKNFNSFSIEKLKEFYVKIGGSENSAEAGIFDLFLPDIDVQDILYDFLHKKITYGDLKGFYRFLDWARNCRLRLDW